MKKLQSKKSTNKHKCFTISGVAICILGIILFILKIWIIEILISSLLVLRPNSLIENIWRKVPDIHTNVYFFNWTNPEDYNNLTVKPKFQEVKPYVFTQSIEKVDVIWNNNNNNTVTYGQLRKFLFDKKSGNTNLSTGINTVNIVTLCLSHHIRNQNYFLKRLVSLYLATTAPHVNTTITARQYFFDGMDDLLLDMAKTFPFVFAEIPRFEKLTLFTASNVSKDFEGVFNMDNGTDGSFEIRNWNFNNMTSKFDESCAKVHGSSGELYSIKLITKKYIGIFASALCRYVKLDYEDEVTINGILGYKYSVGDSLLDNGTLIPGNECYCGETCLPSGMIDLSLCHYGFPLFLSLPHFYSADPIYLETVEGLNPKKYKHETYVIIEPTTGILLEARIRLQLNAQIQHIKDISVFESLREFILPVAWMDQKANLPDNILLLLKICLMLPHLLTGIASILTVLGIILICIPFLPKIVAWFKKLRKQKEVILVIPEEIPLRPCDKSIETKIS